jgi:glycosyltransferase 2 family protein
LLKLNIIELNTSNNNKKPVISTKRLWLATIIGVVLSSALLVFEMSQPNYKEVFNGKGTHQLKLNSTDEYIFSENGDYIELDLFEVLNSVTFTNYSWLFLVLAIVFMFFRDLGYTWRLRHLCEKTIPFKRSFIVILIWEFASAISPGIVGGSALAMFIINREGVSLGKSTAIVISTAILDNLFYVVFGFIFILFFPAQSLFGDGSESIIGMFWTGYTVLCIITIVLLLMVFVFPRLIGWVLLGFSKISFFKKFKPRLKEIAVEIRVTSIEMRKKSFLFWLKSFGFTCFSWFSRFLVVNCIIMIFAGVLGYENIKILAKQFIMWLGMLLTPTPGASGGAEYLFKVAMTDYFDYSVVVVLAAVIWRLMSYFPYLFIGALILPKWFKTTSKKL